MGYVGCGNTWGVGYAGRGIRGAWDTRGMGIRGDVGNKLGTRHKLYDTITTSSARPGRMPSGNPGRAECWAISPLGRPADMSIPGGYDDYVTSNASICTDNYMT